MTIQDLGSIGELVAAIAVLVSLFYLAYQIRQNTAELRSASLRAVTSSYSNFRRSVMESDELAKILDAARVDPESLDRAQAYRFGYLIEESVWCAQLLYIEIQAGQVSSTSWPHAKMRLLEHLDNSVGRTWWEKWKGMYAAEMVGEIDSALSRRDA